MNRNIIIYGGTFERAVAKLEELLGEMKYKEVESVLKTKSCFVVRLNNRDEYKAIFAGDSARGHKWNYAYIDYTVSKEMMNMIQASFASYPLRDINMTDCYEIFDL